MLAADQAGTYLYAGPGMHLYQPTADCNRWTAIHRIFANRGCVLRRQVPGLCTDGSGGELGRVQVKQRKVQRLHLDPRLASPFQFGDP